MREGDFECAIITGGGTGTFSFELAGGVHNEIQPGSFLFMDGDYHQNEDEEKFEQSLFVHTTVTLTETLSSRLNLSQPNRLLSEML